MENKELAKEYVLEEVISKSVQIPGVKVSRDKFLAEEFSLYSKSLDEVIEKGPIDAGIEREKIDEIASKLIFKRTSQSSLASFVAGIPGGLAMAATIPVDILQFFGMALKLAQELSYIYGAQDLWIEGKVDDDRIKNQLIMYCGVMFGVSGAVSGVRVISTQVAKTTLKKLPQKALTKTFWYPMLKKITAQIGVRMTKTTLAQGVSKVVPIVGGVISGSLNFASMMPMAKRLKDTFDKASFDYSDKEFLMDVDNILNVNEVDETKDNNNSVKSKLSNSLNVVKKSANNLTSKFKNINNDKYEEVKKLKELLDLGIITEDEFVSKKKDLLDL
jgi:hypothetical protein